MKLNASLPLKLTLLGISPLGITSPSVSASSTVVWGQTKLWVALVLDNSGSMSQGDSNGTKMAALQNGANQLLTILHNAATHPGDVQVSIVPFVKSVNVGTGNSGAGWIDWTDWDNPPIVDQTNYVYQQDTDIMINNDPLNTFGPGDSCPYTNSAQGYRCVGSSTNDTNCSGSGGSSCVSTIPSNGNICPSMHAGGTQDGLGYHFYNGCWTGATSTTTAVIATGSTASCTGHSTGTGGNCSCATVSGVKTCTTKVWNHVWVANNHSSWTGCLMDRKQSFDASNATPAGPSTNFPAENNQYCGTATVTPLGYNWSSLTTQVNAMTAYGATNQAIGIAHGWQTISTGSPYGAPAVPDDTTRYIIFFSDGLNTMNRWWGDGSTEGTTADGYIDDREKAACDAAKADGVVIYSIYVHVGGTGGSGNSAPLQYCATDPTKYFALTTTNGVVTTFNQIAQQITNVRVVK